MRRMVLFTALTGLALLPSAVHVAAADEMGLLRTMGSPNEELGSGFGRVMAGGFDYDGDTRPDLVVAASSESPYPSPTGAGRVYALSGWDGSTLLELTSPNEQVNGHFGVSVSTTGDVDGGGRPDVVVGASWENPGLSPDYSGRAYVMSGETGSVVHQLVSPDPQWAGHFGAAVAGATDLDGDGLPDIVVGAIGESSGVAYEQAGAVHVFSGATASLIMTLTSPNEQTGGRFGTAIVSTGDLDGDGCGDLLIGAPWEDGHIFDTGRAYVISGATGSLIHELSHADVGMEDLFGATVAALGDIDGDGLDDVCVGAPHTDTGEDRDSAGRVYVFSGATGVPIHALASPNPETEGHFGFSVARAGDLDGDGRPDVAVGAYYEDPGTAPDESGRAYMFSGLTGTLLYSLESPNEEEHGTLGHAIAGAGDVNGDGLGEVAVSAPYESPGLSPPYAGRVYLVTPAMLLWGELQTGELALSWTPIVPAAAYWAYGASNNTHFLPDLTPPYQHRLTILSPGWSSWSVGNGIGDPDSNWTYLLGAVDTTGQERETANRIGEFHFGLSCSR